MGSTEFKAWHAGLSDLSEDQLLNGMENARGYTDFFTLPAFRELCQAAPEAEGIPPVEQAYEEACLAPSPKAKAAWSHPIVYRAGALAGWSDLHALTRTEGLKRYKYHYEILKRRVAAGEDLSMDVPEAIPDRVVRVLPTEEALSEVEKLWEALS